MKNSYFFPIIFIGFLLSCYTNNKHNKGQSPCFSSFLAEDSINYIFALDSSFVIDDSINACRLVWRHWVGAGTTREDFFPAFTYQGIIYMINRVVYSIPKGEDCPFVLFDYNMVPGEEKTIFFYNVFNYPGETNYTLKLEEIIWDKKSQDSIYIFRFSNFGVMIQSKWIDDRDDYIIYTSENAGIWGICFGIQDEIEDIVYGCSGRVQF